MVDFKNFSIDKATIIIPIIIFIGIVLRFQHQFINWSYNGDEVNLGLDILNHNLSELFSPFKSRQSAPPLFLLIEKTISIVAKPYISLKIISFLASCASVFLFNKVLKNSYSKITQITLLALFCLNPFILSNSLTLKQYSIDLMMGLIAINFFVNAKYNIKTFSFFCVFCLISNVGLFFCASFAIYHSIKCLNEVHAKLNFLNNWFKKIWPYFFAPVPYLLFFIWFMGEPGAENMKNFMISFWEGAFLPLDSTFIRWLAIQIKVISIFFFSTYWVVGVPMLILFCYGAYILFQNTRQVFDKYRIGIVIIYIFTIIIHLILSSLKMYPFSDRLFLYIAPGIYLILGIGIENIIMQYKATSKFRFFRYLGILIPVITVVLYFSYLPKKSNNVYKLMEFVKSEDLSIVFTPKARQRSLEWQEFTQYYNGFNFKLLQYNKYEVEDEYKGDLLISVQSEKFGHKLKYSSPEPVITKLLKQDKIILSKRIEGYAIYKFK